MLPSFAEGEGMRQILLLIGMVLVVGCGDDDGGPGDASDTDSDVTDSGSDAVLDAPADVASDTATDVASDAVSDVSTDVSSDTDVGDASGCPTVAAGVCTAERGGAPCRYDDSVCVCARPCTGVPPPDGTPSMWACVHRPEACPVGIPTEGAPCGNAGLRCTYGTCGSVTGTCTDSTWDVVEMPPPP
jgi:hypothetical protein